MSQMMDRFDQQQLTYEKLLQEKDREMQNAVSDRQRQLQIRLEKREPSNPRGAECSSCRTSVECELYHNR